MSLTTNTQVQVSIENFVDFAAIPEDNGPVYMRSDVTDMPGYWDSVVDSPPERREWYEEWFSLAAHR